MTLDKFFDPDIEVMREARESIDHYEWAISDDGSGSRLVHKWKSINNILVLSDQVSCLGLSMLGIVCDTFEYAF